MGTYWADTSQYQGKPIDDSYPHRVYCFRTNSGNAKDLLGVENARRALDMLKRGRLDLVIPYYFFWPGQANCDLHKDLLVEAGLWQHSRTVSMVDVEGAPKDGVKRVRGNQSIEVNDEVERLRGWYGNPRRVIGYWNPRADPELWSPRPAGLRLVIPQYGRQPGDLGSIAAPIRDEAFAHQYTDVGRATPWPNGIDLNYSPLDIGQLLEMFGITEGAKPMGDVVKEGAGQLHPFPAKIRQINHPENVNESTRSPEAPWPYDRESDVWNETVWDGYDFAAAFAELPDSEKRSLVGLIRTIGARQSRIEKKIDAIIAAVGNVPGVK